MIIAAPFRQLGAEQAHASVKRLQLALEQVANRSGNQAFNPNSYGTHKTADGIIDASTAYALFQVARAGLLKIPGLSTLINQIPNFLTSWTVFEQAYKYKLEDTIDPEILRLADAIDAGLQAALAAIGTGGSGPVVKDFKLITATFIPPGSFAIRDPALNKYRILSPIE